MQSNSTFKQRLAGYLKSIADNKVVLLFVALCLFGVAFSGKPVSLTVTEVFTRFGRNAFLVLALIIPVLAGLGLNFGIVVGAIAAQIAIFCTVYWGFTGVKGILMCVAICTPLAILFGYLVGALFNKTKGTEMITGLVLGYFADGLYQLLFLFIIGGVIPVNNPTLIINGGVGVKNTIDLTGNLKYAIDTVSMLSIARVVFAIYMVITIVTLIVRLARKGDLKLKATLVRTAIVAVVFGLTFIPFVRDFMSTDRLNLVNAVEIACVLAVVWAVGKFVCDKFILKKEANLRKSIALIIAAGIAYGLTWVNPVYEVLKAVNIPVCTYLLIFMLCFFNKWLLSTKLGQDMRTVGQSRTVANAAGINVDRTRIIAMCISTVLASWGQLIFLQNLGTFSTYGAHTQVGLYAIAALLVGGASVQRANNKQAVIGIILFHTLFVVAPLAASNLLGSALIGEYFRVFVCYGVIAASLAMHAWKTHVKPRLKDNKGGGGDAAAPAGTPEAAALAQAEDTPV